MGGVDGSLFYFKMIDTVYADDDLKACYENDRGGTLCLALRGKCEWLTGFPITLLVLL